MRFIGKTVLPLTAMTLVAACSDSEPDAQSTQFSYANSDFELECDKGFLALTADALAIEGMDLVTETQEQRAYMAGGVSYTITKEGHAAHPAIVRRDVVVKGPEDISIAMAVCGYGSQQAAEALVQRMDILNEQYLLRLKITVKDATTPGVNDPISPDDEPMDEPTTFDVEESGSDQDETAPIAEDSE